GVQCGLELAHALAFEFDPVGVVDDAIEDGVGKRWIADDLVPALDRQLAGDENRTDIVAILDDLKQVAALFSVELLWSPVIENEEIDARKSAQELRVSSVAASESESHEQSRHAVIEDGEVLAAGLVTERAGEPAFADAARAGDQQIAPFTDEVAGGELEEQGAIEAASGVIIDVFNTGVVAQPRGSGTRLEALLPAQRHLVCEQEA